MNMMQTQERLNYGEIIMGLDTFIDRGIPPKRETISMRDLGNFEVTTKNKLEIWLDKYNHIMEFLRTIFAIIMIGLQLYIISQLL